MKPSLYKIILNYVYFLREVSERVPITPKDYSSYCFDHQAGLWKGKLALRVQPASEEAPGLGPQRLTQAWSSADDTGTPTGLNALLLPGDTLKPGTLEFDEAQK